MEEIEKIRKMSDEELIEYLNKLRSGKSNNCIKCNSPKSNYVIYVKNLKKCQQRKLCCLCKECYDDLLNHLKTIDIDWNYQYER